MYDEMRKPKHKLTEEEKKEEERKYYESLSFEQKVDYIYESALTKFEEKKMNEFSKILSTEEFFEFTRHGINDLKDAKRKEFKELARQTVEIEESGNFTGTYKKGFFIHRYKENSRAKEQSNRRKRNKRPDNISKDYTTFIYDLVKKDDKIIRILNKKRAEDLVWMLDYQFKIKFTKITFWVYGEDKPRVATKIEDIKDFILQGTIDLSRGLYAHQIHHVDICRKTRADFAGQSDKGMYNVIKNMMIKRGYYLICYFKGGKKKVYIFKIEDLTRLWKLIDFDRMTLLIEKRPEKEGERRWNAEYNGYWMVLGKLTTKEEARDFEIRNRVERPIRKISFIKSAMDEIAATNGSIDSDMNFLNFELLPYDNFSYKRCNELLETGELINIIDKNYGHLIDKSSFIRFKDQIHSVITFIGNKLSSFYNRLTLSLVVRFARALNINIDDKFVSNNTLECDFCNSYMEIYNKARDYRLEDRNDDFYLRYLLLETYKDCQEDYERSDLFEYVYF